MLMQWAYKGTFRNVQARNNTERLKFQDYHICPNILHVDDDADWGGGIVIALLHYSAVGLINKDWPMHSCNKGYHNYFNFNFCWRNKDNM